MLVFEETRALHIRPVGPFDLGRVARLHRRCFTEAWSRRDLAHLLAMPGTFGLLARLQEPRRFVLDPRRDVGFAICRVAADESELLSIGVAPEWRGRGIAAALLEAALARCRALGARRMFLEVDVDNRPAQHLYERFGFTRVGLRPDYYRHADGRRSDAWTMRRELATPEAEPIRRAAGDGV